MSNRGKTSKAQKIRDLLKQGKGSVEIRKITKSSFAYIRNMREDIKKPGILARRTKSWLSSSIGSTHKYVKQWKKNNKKKLAKCKKRNLARHAKATESSAFNHRERWTTKDLRYLKEYGKTRTAEQLAIDLGRTYQAILSVAHIYRIDLRGNKTKTHSSRVTNTSTQLLSESVSQIYV